MTEGEEQSKVELKYGMQSPVLPEIVLPDTVPQSLAWAHPVIQEWFVQRFSTPTEPQEQGWPHILAGKPTLISAPTPLVKLSHSPFSIIGRSFQVAHLLTEPQRLAKSSRRCVRERVSRLRCQVLRT